MGNRPIWELSIKTNIHTDPPPEILFEPIHHFTEHVLCIENEIQPCSKGMLRTCQKFITRLVNFEQLGARSCILRRQAGLGRKGFARCACSA
jgi:hypothetical protein